MPIALMVASAIASSAAVAGSVSSTKISLVVISPSGTAIVVTFPHLWDCVIGLPRCAVRRLLLSGLMADATGTTHQFFVKYSFFFVLF